MPRRDVLAWCLAIGLSLTLGCGSKHGEIFRLTNADAGRTVVTEAGDTVEITLQTVGPGRYGIPVVSSGSVVFVGESAVGPPVPAGPTQLYRFKAVASGQADITVPHAGDGAPEAAVPAFSIAVQVL